VFQSRCKKCRHEFCWMCKAPWSTHGSHTGGYYTCNKYVYLRLIFFWVILNNFHNRTHKNTVNLLCMGVPHQPLMINIDIIIQVLFLKTRIIDYYNFIFAGYSHHRDSIPALLKVYEGLKANFHLYEKDVRKGLFCLFFILLNK